MNEKLSGALIERGAIEKIEAGGYRVESITRPGISTPALKSLVAGETLVPGDQVYFFLFPDGDGLIIAKL